MPSLSSRTQVGPHLQSRVAAWILFLKTSLPGAGHLQDGSSPCDTDRNQLNVLVFCSIPTPSFLNPTGLAAAADTAFVLVAGGLGERLGYSGIKLALPVESATGGCYLKLYIESILALQVCENV